MQSTFFNIKHQARKHVLKILGLKITPTLPSKEQTKHSYNHNCFTKMLPKGSSFQRKGLEDKDVSDDKLPGPVPTTTPAPETIDPA